ncbi:hypothetical protein CKO45_27300 [Paracraurococcus ruber]|uniref:Uncharacterized protein n=1 Tax=Paracraurococcus ruber TaxID=77675 RepID=A0ABS1D5D1_9PROT|nr:hypothetical protein [Paracraurococcus ruber]
MVKMAGFGGDAATRRGNSRMSIIREAADCLPRGRLPLACREPGPPRGAIRAKDLDPAAEEARLVARPGAVSLIRVALPLRPMGQDPGQQGPGRLAPGAAQALELPGRMLAARGMPAQPVRPGAQRRGLVPDPGARFRRSGQAASATG